MPPSTDMPQPRPDASHAHAHAAGHRTISGLGDEAGHASTSTSTGTSGGGGTKLPVLSLDSRTFSRSLDCVHCGLCLPACPTYTQTGLEADSPRGRIQLMKGLATGRIEASEGVLDHLDLCLDCRACETACPSGVVYHELIEETREKLAATRKQTLIDRGVNWMFFNVFPHPTRLKLALLPPRVLQALGLWKLATHPSLMKLLPLKLQKMQQMLPPKGPMWESDLHTSYEPTPGSSTSPSTKTTTVGFFPGCVGSVLFGDVNRQTVDLLQLAGCRVLVPRAQQCCGAIHHHGGKAHEAMAMARANIDAFVAPDGSPRVDVIATNIAGCGAMLKDYDHLLRDDTKYAKRAKTYVSLLKDINQLLATLTLPAPKHAVNQTATYHDACHLAHAQKVTAEPRKLLASIGGLKMVPLPESEMCCGAAGTYNLSQPAMARDLADRKLDHIKSTGASVCVTANVGCAMQIQSEAARRGQPLTVVHPVTLLHRAHFG